jgi:cell division protein FtsQ
MQGRRAKPPKRSPAKDAPRFGSRMQIPARIKRLARRWLSPIRAWRLPKGAGIAASATLILVSIGYGAIKGDHLAAAVAQLKDARDSIANAVGFRIGEISLAGRRHLAEKEVLALAGVSERTSLLFLDVEAARAGLKASPWIAEASVRKLYPGRLQIEIVERDGFALWQKDAKVSVIAVDGTVLAPLGEPRHAALPLVVGPGAEKKARDFLAVLDRYPAIRDQVRASILVGERRWNLKLKNGIDVRLPEANPERALETLAGLDETKKLLTRDITAIDLRLPDRVSVRLSDAAAQAREEALKAKKAKRKGGDA